MYKTCVNLVVCVVCGVVRCRVDISDTLMYVYEMLGAELLSSLYERLGGLVLGPGRGGAWQVAPHHTAHSEPSIHTVQ